MKNKFKSIFIFIVSVSIIACNIPITSFASEESTESSTSSGASTNDWYNSTGQTWDQLEWYERIEYLWLTACYDVGVVITDLDFDKVCDYTQEFLFYMNDDYVIQSTYSDEVYEDMLEELEGKYSIVESNGEEQIKLTSELLSSFKSFITEWIEENETPLYYTVEIPSIDVVYASNCGATYAYRQLKQAVQEFGVVGVAFYTSYVNIYDLSSCFDNTFFLYESRTAPSSSYPDLYRYFAKCYDVSSENLHFSYRYSLYYDDDYSLVTDIANNFTSRSYSHYFSSVSINNLSIYQAVDGSTSYVSSFMVADEPKYIRVFSSLTNYQNYISDTYTAPVYYTTNYYVTNYTDTSMSLNDLTTLYEAYADLCNKIIQWVMDNQDASETDTMAYIESLLGSLSGTVSDISGNSSAIVEQNKETNNWLEKIYNKVVEILDAVQNIKLDFSPVLIANDFNADFEGTLSAIIDSPDVEIPNLALNIQSGISSAIDKLKTKFPFSIPWDIAFLISALASEPQAPTFELPIQINSWNIDETITIDMSDFQTVSDVSRTLLSMLFLMYLLQLTTKLVDFNEGG